MSKATAESRAHDKVRREFWEQRKREQKERERPVTFPPLTAEQRARIYDIFPNGVYDGVTRKI